MKPSLKRRVAWFAILALLANLAAHVASGAAMASAASTSAAAQPGGGLIVICTPQGMKRLAWTGEGYAPVPDDEGTAKQPCPFCGPLSAGVLLPELPQLAAPLLLATASFRSGVSDRPAVVQPCGPPPARAPPRAV
jgi:hypothetical protein